MRFSILTRLLIVSLAILTCSMVATALITTRSTTNQLQSELARSIDAGDKIYDQLLAHAEQNPTWDGVQAIVDSLAASTGRRISLTTPAGALIATSVHPGQRSSAPDHAAAVRVDALATLVQASPATLSIEVNNAITDGVATCLTSANLVAWRAVDSSGRMLVTLQDRGSGTDVSLATCQTKAAREVLEPRVAPAALLYVTTPTAPTPSWLDRAGGTRIVLALLAVLLVTVVITLSAARRLLRPIRSMTRATQRIAAGDRRARVRVEGTDEIARLGAAFNSMADALAHIEGQRQQLVSDVAHELRNPLANVRGYLEAAQDDVVRADGPWIESLLEETLLLQHLIDDLQDLALADAGQLHIHAEPADAATLAAQVVAAHRPQALAAGVSMHVYAPGSVPLLADAVRIRQVLGNLVSNALHYTPPNGAVTVSVRREPSMIVIDVADTGIGIEPEHLAHLFDRFYRPDSSRSRETGGSGLGLAIVRHLVHAHGGAVGVTSAVGRGSTFSIRLPYQPTAVGPIAVGQRARRPETMAEALTE